MRSRGKLKGKNDAGPQYLVLRDQMALNIELGKLPAGTRLPSERKLQSDSGAARLTSSISAMQPAQLLPRPDFKVQSDGGVDRGRRLIVLLRKLSPITQAEGKNE
jgi:hypothetical protein